MLKTEAKFLLYLYGGIVSLNVIFAVWFRLKNKASIYSNLLRLWVSVLWSFLMAGLTQDRPLAFLLVAVMPGCYVAAESMGEVLLRFIDAKPNYRVPRFILGTGSLLCVLLYLAGLPFIVYSAPISAVIIGPYVYSLGRLWREKKNPLTPAKLGLVLTCTLMSLHGLDLPVLGNRPDMIVIAFSIGLLVAICFSVFSPMVLVEISAADAIRLRDDFMSIAAHELRTPITPLKIQLQLLKTMLKPQLFQNPSQGEQILKLIDTSDRHIIRLTHLLENLLDTSRITAGRLTLNLEPLHLSRLVQDVVERFSAELQKAGCIVELDLQADPVGKWDYLRLEQVFANLLTNAMKYGSGKPVRVTVKGHGHHAELSVQDFGIGIAKVDQKRIFERFERAVPITKFGGLGLGLFISRQIIETHKGSIQVKSTPGQGATFMISLPC